MPWGRSKTPGQAMSMQRVYSGGHEPCTQQERRYDQGTPARCRSRAHAQQRPACTTPPPSGPRPRPRHHEPRTVPCGCATSKR